MQHPSIERKAMRMAFLLDWRNKGFSRPRYGLIDDEELLRTGTTMLYMTNGERVVTRRQEILLLEHVKEESLPESAISARAEANAGARSP